MRPYSWLFALDYCVDMLAVGESKVLSITHECEPASSRVSAFRTAGLGTEWCHDGSVHGQHGLLLPSQWRHCDGDNWMDGEVYRRAGTLQSTKDWRRRPMVPRRQRCDSDAWLRSSDARWYSWLLLPSCVHRLVRWWLDHWRILARAMSKGSSLYHVSKILQCWCSVV